MSRQDLHLRVRGSQGLLACDFFFSGTFRAPDIVFADGHVMSTAPLRGKPGTPDQPMLTTPRLLSDAAR